MAQYHVNPETGNPGPCKATQGGCPFGGENEHFSSLENARAAYEVKMGQAFAQDENRYVREALSATELLINMEARAEEYPGTSAELHAELAELQRQISYAAESHRLRSSDPEERAAWERTAARAAYEHAAHLVASLELSPRPADSDRNERRAEIQDARIDRNRAHEEYLDLKEEYFDSPAQEAQLAYQLHDEWVAARGGEPRWIEGRDRQLVDLASTPLEKLPERWQQERVLAARSALAAVREAEGNLELAAAQIHRDWLTRNGATAKPHQLAPYHMLSEEEKEKDRMLARAAHAILA